MYRNGGTPAGKSNRAVGKKRARMNARTQTFGAAGPCVSLITGQEIRPQPVARPKKAGKSKVRRAERRIERKAFVIPSPSEVMAARTPAGAWTAAQLAEWGIQWPPVIGWRSFLSAAWTQEGRAVHDTVFDVVARDAWLQITSGHRLRLVNVRPV